MNRYLLAACVPAASLIAGCATTAQQTEMYDLQNRVINLEKQVAGSTSQVTETSANLSARVDALETQIRAAQTHGEDTDQRVVSIERQLQDIKSRVYSSLGMSSGAGTTGGSPNAEAGNIVVQTPAGDTVSVTTPAPQSSAAPMSTEPNELETFNVAAATPAPAPAAPAAPTPPPAVEQPAPPPAPAPAPAAPAGDPQVYYQAAQKSYASDNFQQALTQFDDFLQRYPGSELAANAQFWKAKAHLKLGQHQEAINQFQKLINNYPNNTKVPYAIHNQAVAHSNLGQIQEATRLMQRVVDEYPLSPAADQAKSDLKQLQGS